MKFVLKLLFGRLNAKDKVGLLLNELLKAVQATGKQLVRESDGFGGLHIWMHHCGTEKAELVIENAPEGFKISTKPNFEITGVQR